MTLLDELLAVPPALCWPLTESSGTVAADVSPNARPGTYSAAPVSGQVLVHEPSGFNGSVGTIHVARAYDAALSPGTGDWAVCFFYKGPRPSSLGTDNFETIFLRDFNSSGGGLIIYVCGPNSASGTLIPGTLRIWCGSGVLQGSGYDIQDSTPHFVWCERRSGVVSVYIDGALKSSSTLASSANGTNSPAVRVGASDISGSPGNLGSIGYGLRNPIEYLTYWVGTIPSVAQARRIMDAGFRRFDTQSTLLTQLLQDIPVGYWPMQETTGSTAVDLIAGRNITWAGTGVVVGSAGPAGGKAVLLNGTAGYGNTSAASAFATTGSFSAMIAFAMTTVTSGRTLLGVGTTGNPIGPTIDYYNVNSWGLRADITGQSGNTNYRLAYSNFTPAAATWYLNHITWDNVSGTLSQYINGVLMASNTASGGGPRDTFASPSIYVGRYLDDSQYWPGSAAHLAWFSSVLSPARIKAHSDAFLRSGVLLG